jgi:hypothetical protein
VGKGFSGLLTGTTIMCQCHAVLRGPATTPLVTFEVREQDGKIQVRT